MAFILPAWDGQKRVKYIGPDGSQLPQEDRSWHWLQADLTQKFAQKIKGKQQDEEPSEKPEAKQLTPQEALERIHAARGEVDVILDLVNGIEDGQHLAIGMVTPGQKSMQAQNRERMLALSAKQTALQGAAERLQRGAELLAKRLDQDDRYYAAAAELQKRWKLKAGPSGHAALLHVDLSLPFQVRGRREPPAEQLPLLRLQDGSVQVRNERQRSDPGGGHGLEGISQLLQKQQRALLWASIQRALEAEAAEAEAGNADALHAVAQKMVATCSSEAEGSQELGAMLLSLYLKAVQAGSTKGAGQASPILKPAMAWLQHSILRKEVERSLQVACSATAALQVSWLPVPEQTTSVAVLRRGNGPPFTLIVIEERLYLEGPLCSNTALEGAETGRHSYSGRIELRRGQLSDLLSLINLA
ncbi:hypothetical protein CVIRNUC_005973 [Coccomyxa viridis]|uniref:Mediator complex subunit 17 n=1 Tax=Coccomyxa viridis TaxID=1274662 RepID=A0AAV1I5Z8_9CHLO|nr:hypothetical protein CVIRNUC_005973 [Coccomyxa viridis]